MTHPRTTPPAPVIPGWRVILSDRGRLWASRVVPFTDSQFDLGAERTVDADTLDDLRAEVDRQETTADRAAAQAAGQVPRQATGQATSQTTGGVTP
ncbi:hypothetical protein [Streptosporangium carneum]|uniref:Uncharacterized protein n=1 Tax=Streptosporangium carneum TaxID=47481 RepID=A0A9W6HXX8_9ACTN|nr:hypothetical protein [Streptosporangium carneum]GLK08372.1 hypothetical protein GCM10017600_17770 [Streptosporangium carneum]